MDSATGEGMHSSEGDDFSHLENVLKPDFSEGDEFSHLEDVFKPDFSEGDEFSHLENVFKPDFSEGDEFFHLENAFKPTGSRKICLVEGHAGVGKSLLCRRSAHLWAVGDGKVYGRDFELVVVLSANILTGDLKSDIAMQLFCDDFCLSPEEIYSCLMENQENCLLVIDGMDELNPKAEKCLRSLVKGKILRNVNLLLTGRPEASRDLVKYANVHLQLEGFCRKNLESYVHKYFAKDQNKADTFLERLECNAELMDLARTPFTALLLCALADGAKGSLPTQLHAIYHQVISLLFRKYARKLADSNAECTPVKMSADVQCSGSEKYMETKLFQSAAELAHKLTCWRKDICLENDLPGVCNDADHLLKSGILSRDFTLSRLDAQPCCYFPHRSIQEYLCAWYLSTFSTEELANETQLPVLVSNPAALTYLFRIILQDDNSLIAKVDILWNAMNQAGMQRYFRVICKSAALDAVCESEPNGVIIKYLAERMLASYGDASDFLCNNHLRGFVLLKKNLMLMTELCRKLDSCSSFNKNSDYSLDYVPVLFQIQCKIEYLPRSLQTASVCINRIQARLSTPEIVYLPFLVKSGRIGVSVPALPHKTFLREFDFLFRALPRHYAEQPTVLIQAIEQLHDDTLWGRLLKRSLDRFPTVRLIRVRPTVRVDKTVHRETGLSRTVCVDCRWKTPAHRMYYDRFCAY